MKQKSGKTQAARMAAAGVSLIPGGSTFRGQLAARKKALRKLKWDKFSPAMKWAIMEGHLGAIAKLERLIAWV